MARVPRSHELMTPPPASANRGTRITGDQRSQLATRVSRRYAAGESIRSIAADLSRSYGFVQALLKQAEVPLRGRGGDTRGVQALARRAEVEAQVDRVRAEIDAELGDAARRDDTSRATEAGAKKAKGKKSHSHKGEGGSGKKKRDKSADPKSPDAKQSQKKKSDKKKKKSKK